MHTSARPSAELEHLADTLWRERHVVEFLLFKLVSARLILAAGERRFVACARDEVERVLDLLGEAEAARERGVEAVARLWNEPLDEVTIAELAIRSPEPLSTVFRDHRRAFGGAGDVSALLDDVVSALLSPRGEPADVEDADIAEAILELQTQEVAYTAALQTLGRALPPSLAAFLR
jgi:uncharacterized protein YunC (DUF1805 family)